MKKVLILGAGTAGTMAANKLAKVLPDDEWTITVVDQDNHHIYQPGLLLLPFGVYTEEEICKPRKSQLSKKVKMHFAEISRIKPEENLVEYANGEEESYDYLIIATGTTPRPDQTPGMDDPAVWHKSVFDFYTLPGAVALKQALADFKGGNLVVHITELPLKCPVAPLEFTLLADAFFEEKKMRDKVKITYVTPLEGAFTKPTASSVLGNLFIERNINLEPDFVIERVDGEEMKIVSMDEREVPFDLLVTVPLNMGADFIGESGLGDDLNYVTVDKHNFLSTKFNNIFALGDAADIPASKAGSVAHFAVDSFTGNFVQHINDRPMTHDFDGHANCFIESGHGKGLLIDFNYEVEPLPGKFPLAQIGPMPLLKESRINHLGKLGFRWIYWHMLLPGRKLPVPTKMSMSGKQPIKN